MSTFWTPTMQTYYQQLQNLQDFSTVDQDQGVTRLDRRITATPDGHFDPLIAAFEGHDPQPRVVHIQAPAHFSPQNDAHQQALAVRQTMGILNVNLAPTVTEETLSTAVPITVYQRPYAGQRQCLIFLHGGGFIGGSDAVVANFCKGLVDHSAGRLAVFNINYRLAPEATLDDMQWDVDLAVRWVHDHAADYHAPADALAIGGDSAGATLALEAAYHDRVVNRHWLAHEILIYPLISFTARTEVWPLANYHVAPTDEARLADRLTGMVQLRKMLINIYPGNRTLRDPLVSPGEISDDWLRIFPETLLMTPEFDYLRPQDEAFARHLGALGVPTTDVCYRGMDHAFIDKYGIYPQAEDAAMVINHWLDISQGGKNEVF